ncbi:MAG: 50S ribosomal protein L15 [Sphaerochaetaceae bacterium]|nr:50S ribosomal protein L15 [Spirochaetales bacterium]MDY5500898.1 50S ribosomal protein L15 [Sphaerochaetaceae bacterium]
MAQIVAPKGANTKKTIVGRGASSKGRTCGRGNNGQNSRSGGGVKPGFEGGQMPLYRRLARRGFSNFKFKVTYLPVSLTVLEASFSDGETVSDATLREKGILSGAKTQAKILADGDLSKKLVIEGLKVSAAAGEKIKAAGGEVR